jgi:hypothetical protein
MCWLAEALAEATSRAMTTKHVSAISAHCDARDQGGLPVRQSDWTRWRKSRKISCRPLAAGASTICGLAELTPEFLPERLRGPRRPIASDHFPGPLERMTFGGVIADADNDIPVERACGGGTRRLQRVVHGCGQIVGMVVRRHENLQPAPKGGHQPVRPGIGALSSLT